MSHATFVVVTATIEGNLANTAHFHDNVLKIFVLGDHPGGDTRSDSYLVNKDAIYSYLDHPDHFNLIDLPGV